MKLNIEKCFLGNTKVSYLGFVFTQEGIKPGRDKLRAVKAPQPQADMKAVSSFIGLCNFFRTHINNFATINAPLTKLTRKDSGYNGGPLPKEAIDAFIELKKRLMTDPVVAYPRSDRKYVLITDASTGTDERPRNKLLSVSGRNGSCQLGYGILRQLSQGKAIHVIHRSQATGETQPSPHKNDEQIARKHAHL